MNRSIKKIGEFLLGNEAWPYLILISFIAFAVVGVNGESEARYYVTWIAVLLLIYSSVLFYSASEIKFKTSTSNWKSKVLWFVSYFLLPLCIFIIVAKTPLAQIIDPLLNFKFVKNSDELFFTTIFLSPGLYFLLKFNWFGTMTSKIFWTKRISFLSISIIVVGLISFLLPLISTDFQAFTENNTRTASLTRYIAFVPQVFVISS